MDKPSFARPEAKHKPPRSSRFLPRSFLSCSVTDYNLCDSLAFRVCRSGAVSYRYVCPRCRHSFETPEPRVVQPRCWYCAALMQSGPPPMDLEEFGRRLLEGATSR